jgi:hypothetical protein
MTSFNAFYFFYYREWKKKEVGRKSNPSAFLLLIFDFLEGQACLSYRYISLLN